MRVIKFRFWDKVEKRWMVDGRAETNIYDFAFKHGMNWDFLDKKAAMERVEVVQFTGLLDKNGIEIFEGDILRVHSHDNEHDGQLMAVEWGHLGWTVKSKNWYSLTDHDKFTIVGNIYENQGLL